MAKQRESPEVVKEKIIKAARILFAERGIKGVSIREIAANAGISHALLIRYFGSKSMIVDEILAREISSLTNGPSSNIELNALERLVFIRKLLLSTITERANTLKLIMRAGLDGLYPEKYVDPKTDRAAEKLAVWVESLQAGRPGPDAKLTAAVISGAIFSFVAISPWLMTSVGLAPEEFENRKEDIVDVLIWVLVQATGLPNTTVNAARAIEPV